MAPAAGCGSAVCLFCLSYLYVTQTQSFPPHNAQCQIYTSPSPPHTTAILHTDLQGGQSSSQVDLYYKAYELSLVVVQVVLVLYLYSINWFQSLTKYSMIMVAGVRTSDLVLELELVVCSNEAENWLLVCQAAIKTFGRIYTEIL